MNCYLHGSICTKKGFQVHSSAVVVFAGFIVVQYSGREHELLHHVVLRREAHWTGTVHGKNFIAPEVVHASLR